MPIGRLLNPFALELQNTPARRGAIRVFSWKLSSGSYGRGRVAHWARTNGATMGYRELPDEFGKWNSVFKRFRRWVRADAFYSMFRALASDADFEYAMIDGSIVKVHRSGQGAKGGLCARP